MNAGLRTHLEARIGHDLGHVRIHDDAGAAAAARSLEAEAFTSGSDIFFAEGAFRPETAAGMSLLAHEAVHAVQLSGSRQQRPGVVPQVLPPSHRFEQQADAVALESTLRHAGHIPISSGMAQPVLARAPKPPNQSTAQRAAAAQAQAAKAEADAKAAQAQAAIAQRQGAAAQAQAQKAEAQSSLALDEVRRNELRSVTRARMNFAFTEFVSATKDVREAIHAAARADAEMIGMILSVVVGLAAPGLAGGIAKLANALPISASTPAYRLALAGLDQTFVRALFSSATQVASTVIKREAMALAGESDTDAFITGLERTTHTAMQQISDNLAKNDDTTLGVTCANYDSSVANVDIYRAEIMRLARLFQHEISPAGTSEFAFSEAPGAGGQYDIYSVDYPDGSTKLALLQWKQTGYMGLWGHYYFMTWISSEMQDLAKKRLAQPRGGEPTHLSSSEVKWLPSP
jgi:hypothetical protein